MMISPNGFIESYKNKSYKELLPIRDELMQEIWTFENHSYDSELIMMHPSPEVVYQCNLKYLGELCKLIADKYNQEYVWGDTEGSDSDQNDSDIRMIMKNDKKLGNVELVKSLEDIKHNMQVIDSYLNKGVDPEYTYALNLIKRGICFVVDDCSGRCRFYPSRFIGYAHNTRDKHDNNTRKDGKVTNPAISSILGTKPEPNLELEKEYRQYCEDLGIVARTAGTYGIQRKFWKL